MASDPNGTDRALQRYGAPSIARTNEARWTLAYWPAALALSVLGFIFTPAHWRGEVLAAGAVLILVPEITVLVMRRPQDTFSDWVWHVLGVTTKQPLREWGASHFLALGLYVVLAIHVLTFMWGRNGTWLPGAATAVACWLFYHLFWGWWR